MSRRERWILVAVIVVGTLLRSYGLTDHWGTKDHYNYGGPFLTAHLFCLKQTPLSVSKGVGHTACNEEKDLRLNPTWKDVPEDSKAKLKVIDLGPGSNSRYYRNHPVTFLYMLWGMTEVFGEAEWVYRSTNLLFSILNIFLIFLIACQIWSDRKYALLAAFFQSSFLITIYYATHVDFLGEYSVTFLLLGTLFALKRTWWVAGVMGVVAGLMSWPGFFFFAPLLWVAWRERDGIKTVLAFGALGVVAGIAMIGFLVSNFDFIKTQLGQESYGKNPKSIGELVFFPFKWAKSLFTNHSRLLSPLFFSLSLFELLRIKRSKNRDQKYMNALILTGGTGLITSIVGYSFVMVHNFWFILWIPGFSLLCAKFLGDFLTGRTELSKRVAIPTIILAVALYPYGVYQSNLTHDVINSLALGLLALSFLFHQKFTKRTALGIVLAVGIANFSQVVNYRGEKESQYKFCRNALIHYLETGQPIRADSKNNLTRSKLYCRGIPIQYQQGNR